MTCRNNKVIKLLAVFLAVIMLSSGFVFGEKTGMEVKVSAASYSTAYPNTWVNTGNQVEDLIGVAMTQVGYWGTEYGTGTKYGAWYGNTYAPWCGMFISWCANQAGIPTSIVLKSARANDYRKTGTYHYKDNYIPQRGDILLYNPNNGSGYYFPPKNADGTYSKNQHVAIVCSYEAATGKIWIVHGNATGDKVCYNAIYMSNPAVQSFVTPPYTSGGGTSGGTTVLPEGDYINGDSVRVRSAASTTASILAQVNYGTSVEVLGTVTDADGDKWYKVKIKNTGVEGYVFGAYVTIVTSSSGGGTDTTAKDTINDDGVRLRDGASTVGTNTVTLLYSGQVVNIIETVTDADGDKWYKVSLTKDGTDYTGYVFAEYVNVVEKPAEDPLAKINHIAENGVRLRQGAGTDTNILATLSAGQTVSVINVAYDSAGDAWYYVSLTLNGTSYKGYVFHNLVKINDPLSPTFTAAIDSPSDKLVFDISKENTLSVRGWAFTNLGNAGCYYKIDNGALVKLNTYDRTDVKDVYGSACPNIAVGYAADIDISSLSAGQHTLQIMLTGGTTAKVYATRTFSVSDSVVPEAKECTVTDISSEGYTVNVKVTDNIGVSKVRYAVWTYTDDQDDLKWFDAANAQNGVYSFKVNTSDFTKADDNYYTHIYATDTFGNEVCVKTLFFNPASYKPSVISFSTSGANNVPESITNDYINSQAVIPSEIPTLDGYIFCGWATTENALVAEFVPGQVCSFDSDTVLYAVWKEKDQLLLGDCNADGIVNTTDLAILKKYVSSLDLEYNYAGDLNADGAVNTTDLAIMKKKIASIQ